MTTEGIPPTVFLCESTYTFFSFLFLCTTCIFLALFGVSGPYSCPAWSFLQKAPNLEERKYHSTHRGRDSSSHSLLLDLKPTHCWCCRGSFLRDRGHQSHSTQLRLLLITFWWWLSLPAPEMPPLRHSWQGETESDAMEGVLVMDKHQAARSSWFWWQVSLLPRTEHGQSSRAKQRRDVLPLKIHLTWIQMQLSVRMEGREDTFYDLDLTE